MDFKFSKQIIPSLHKESKYLNLEKNYEFITYRIVRRLKISLRSDFKSQKTVAVALMKKPCLPSKVIDKSAIHPFGYKRNILIQHFQDVIMIL